MADIYTINCNSTAYNIRDNSKSAVTLNGTSYANSTATFYAPTTAGSAGYVLTFSGNTPVWSPSAYFVANDPFFYQYDGTGYVFGANFDSCPVSGSSNLMNSAAIYNTFFGFTTSGKNYKINIDTAGHAYVNVPWVNYYHALLFAAASSSYTTAAVSGTYTRTLPGYSYGCVYHITGRGTASSAIIYVNTTTATSIKITSYHNTIAIAQNTAVTYPYLSLTVFVPADSSYTLVATYVNSLCVDANRLNRYSA